MELQNIFVICYRGETTLSALPVHAQAYIPIYNGFGPLRLSSMAQNESSAMVSETGTMRPSMLWPMSYTSV